MIPLELKRDKDGILYTDDRKLIKGSSILFSSNAAHEERYEQYSFHRFDSTDDYIIKYSVNPPANKKEEDRLIREMLINFRDKQKNISKTDLPIGYFKKWSHIRGLIVRNYKDEPSLKRICDEHDLRLLMKYYCHDDDPLHNVFLLADESLDRVYEMFENSIYYTDLHEGNIILVNNEAKIIDFDVRRVLFDNKDEQLEKILCRYGRFLELVLDSFNLEYDYSETCKDFEEAKVYTKKLENNVRKNIR